MSLIIIHIWQPQQQQKPKKKIEKYTINSEDNYENKHQLTDYKWNNNNNKNK